MSLQTDTDTAIETDTERDFPNLSVAVNTYELPDIKTQLQYVHEHMFDDEYKNEYMKVNVTMFYNMYKHGIIVPEIPPYYVANYQWGLNENYDAANTAYLQCIDEMGNELNYGIIQEYAEFRCDAYDDYQGAMKYYELAATECPNVACYCYSQCANLIAKDTNDYNAAIEYCLYSIACIKTCDDFAKNAFTAYFTYSNILRWYRGDIDRATHYSFMAFQYAPYWYMNIIAFPLIQKRPYKTDIHSEYNFRQSSLYKQWHSQRKIDNTSELYDKTGAHIPKHECTICYSTPYTIYRYACVIHTYCKGCYRKIKQCALCKMVEHPMYATMFECNKK